ncbi:hypothetical protein TH53_20855 [Pedobacter lusitanus]|uniref:Cyclic nucleotide-binding domain-containing protein n=1 Tax=Pedobacter lusitanus TaxID=1503925 RepID=A0A0D0F1B1_9SPHI|nr:Crp/Fnr family transcriptional regulator [Pedobacter lusitanus]KIO75423.1 hypothetical protein TH53_20855 [Pedobacter lusitanus]
MEKERLFNIFSQYHPVSEALKAYMNTVLVKEYGAKGQQLIKAGQIPANCWFMAKGSARVYVNSPPQQITTWYWHADQIIHAHSGFPGQTPTDENIELLEDSTLFSLAYSAIPQLIRLFPAFYQIEAGLKEVQQYNLSEQTTELKEDVCKRFVRLSGRFPSRMNENCKRDIAAYLGVTPDILCPLTT